MKCFKPNDVMCGDVIERVTWKPVVLLVIAVDRNERSIDVVMILGESFSLKIGETLRTRYTSKNWKRFDPCYHFLSRGWAETLCLEQEHASLVERETMTE